MILGEDHYGSHGEHYSGRRIIQARKLAQKRIDKLEKAGIRCKLTGYNGGYIRFIGYTPEAEALLEKERTGIHHRPSAMANQTDSNQLNLSIWNRTI